LNSKYLNASSCLYLLEKKMEEKLEMSTLALAIFPNKSPVVDPR
jgi:hypothetical protein